MINTVFSSATVKDRQLYFNVHYIILSKKDCNSNEQVIYSRDVPVFFMYEVNGVLRPE
jgi:hypothetical protein